MTATGWHRITKSDYFIIFEGRDTAGKGGAILRFVRYINPRHYRRHALLLSGDSSGPVAIRRNVAADRIHFIIDRALPTGSHALICESILHGLIANVPFTPKS